jgi:hypothetical protein
VPTGDDNLPTQLTNDEERLSLQHVLAPTREINFEVFLESVLWGGLILWVYLLLIFGVNPLSGRENEDGVLKMENQRLLRLVRCERDKQWRERDMRDVRGERVYVL